MKEYIIRCENNKFTIKGEIVRCKDCKWFDVNKANFVEGYGYCEQYEVTDKDSHYCGYGERKEKHQLSEETSTNEGDAESATTTDCISRQAAIDAVANGIWHFPNECYQDLNDYGMALALAMDALAGLPPVTPTERKEAKRLAREDCRKGW